MNADEAWIGKVMFVGIVIAAIWGIQALLSAKGEGARRLRLVIGGLIALGVAAFIVAAGGPLALIVIVAGLGVSVWVAKGFKK